MEKPLKMTVTGVLAMVLVAAIGIWWITQPEPVAPPPEPTTPKVKVEPIRAANTPAPTPEAATTPPVPPPVKQPAPEVAAQLHAEVNTAIAGYFTLLNAGDFGALLTTYTPPDKLAANLQAMGLTLDQLAEKYKENPLLRHELQNTADMMTAMKDATPTYNEAGDRAIYQLTPPVAGRDEAVWVKINGQWYFDE